MEPASQAERLIRQLRAFKQRLLNLDTRNQSLFLRRIVRKRAFDLLGGPADEGAPDLAAGWRDKLWKPVVRGTGQVLLLPDSDASVAADRARQGLKQLQRFASALHEEKGLQETYLGLCWLEGFLDEHTYVRGPFVLVPCAIDRKREGRGQGFVLRFDESQAPEVNTALSAAITKHRGTVVPADATERLQDVLARLRESGAEDGASLFDALCGFVGSLGLPFAPTRFDDLLGIAPMGRAEVDAAPKGAVRLRSHAVVGVFPQASSALFADFEEMVARAEQGEVDQGIVDNLVDAAADDPREDAPPATVDLDAVPDERINTVLPSDPSQDAVIVKAKDAKCLVVRGPPGTGKSQVIVNLIADALSRGDRVLVCCQKRAALDVVHRRLREAGLGDAAFLVHDGERDRPLLYRKMHGILTAPQPPPAATAEPATVLAARIDGLVRELKAVAEPTGALVHGARLYGLYGRARPGFRAQGVVPPGVAALDDHGLRDACDRLARAQEGALRFDREGPLARRRSWAALGPLDRQAMADGLAELLAVEAPVPRPLDAAWVGDARSLLPRYLALRPRWYRHVHPGWHRSRRFVKRSAAALAGVAEEGWGAAVERAARAEAAVKGLSRFFEEDALWEGRAEPDRLRALREEAQFAAVQEHDRRKDAMAEAERGMLAACLRTLPADADWAGHVLQEATLLWIDEAERHFEALRGEPLARYERLRGELRDALAAKREAVAREVLAETRRRQTTPSFPPDAEVHPNRKASTDWNRLGYELGKKRRVKPLRALLREFGWPLRQIAPAWLASPEVVSEVFPLERDLFDLAIFDEASQLDVERALPVLYRARRVVVAGDEQQMPPTHWFEASRDDEEEAQEDDFGLDAQRTDSLLVAAKRIYGFDYLGWHYRSRYQELIDWSNHAFYDGALQVAANTARATGHAAIEWVPAGGTWDRQLNPVEVRRCAELLHDLLRRDPSRSIGVITFNAKQMEALKDEIDRRSQEDADFAALWGAAAAEDRPLDDRPFVKNLENVQGDERDVIVLSVGYGPGADGTFRRHFGVLNREGGENFLNVAVTRARERVVVVCSFEPEQLAVETSTHVGPVRFKQYLLYAKSVSALRPDETRRVLAELNPDVLVQPAARSKAFESPFEQEVHDALAARGYGVDTQVGLSGYRIDLAVVDPREPHRYCLGIECDGAAFHSGRSVRERDVARQAFLEGRGWTIHRVWSRHWWSDREGEVRKLVERLPPAG